MIKWLVEKWIDKKNENILGNNEKSKQIAKEIIKKYNIENKYDVEYFLDDKMEYKLDEFDIFDKFLFKYNEIGKIKL